VPNHPGLFLVLYGVVGELVVVGVLVTVGVLVADEVLAEADALAVGDVLWVGVGVADFTGGELTTGLYDCVGCVGTRLGCGDGLRLGLGLGEGVGLVELRCCAVLPVGALPWPWAAMWPDRYRPTATATAHKTAVAPAGTSQRRRLSVPEPPRPRPGPPDGPPGAESAAP
jgi:hypothetical protein